MADESNLLDMFCETHDTKYIDKLSHETLLFFLLCSKKSSRDEYS